MKWFKHDSCANRDAKLEKVLMKFGAEGYALYWLCLELIADRIDKDHVDFALEHDAETIGARLHIDTLKVEEIMKFFVSRDLFESDGARITCLKLASRIENSNVKSRQIKELQEIIRENPGKSGKCREKSGQIRLDKIRKENIKSEEAYANEGGKTDPEPSFRIDLPSPGMNTPASLSGLLASMQVQA